MTTDEIGDVFAELRRLDVDLGRPPGLALGTGFRDGEFLSWLRSLPDALGHDAFVGRLDEHVTAAEPNAGSSLPRRPDGSRHRQWPTVEQLNAAIDVLRREWDPLGARLGDLSTEDVMHHAQNALGIVLRGGDPERIERQISADLCSLEQEVFAVRPSPRSQRRYLARRIIRVVVDDPGEAHDEDPWEEMQRSIAASMEIARAEGRVKESRNGVTACFGPQGGEPPALDPEASCTQCGTIGTAAVVGREVEPLVLRFCPTCWAGVRAQYWPPWRTTHEQTEARTPEELIATHDRLAAEMLSAARARMRYAGSAMWEDHLPMFNASIAPKEGTSAAEHEIVLRRLAVDLVARAPRMYGPMPPEVEAFVRQFGAPGQPPASPSDQH